MNTKSIIKLCRPNQWVKNLFVMLPLFFSGNILNGQLAIDALVALLSFCLASSAIYCLNDYIDADADRQHPIKCHRPVASGEIGKSTCILLMSVLSLASVGILFVLPTSSMQNSAIVIGAYLVMNYAYCFNLKRVALVDVVIISIGFVLRVVIGGTSTSIFISHWIIIMTFLLALFLSLSKRRDDIMLFQQTGKKMRHNIDRYNLEFMNQATTLVATVMLVSYIMYTVSPEVVMRFNSNLVYVSSIFVLIGLLRYIQLAVVFTNSGSPTRILLRDRFIQLCLMGWIMTFALIIYF
ncbi:MAG: decaprenyl-phosphate phosphoribosyltransferase [Muribaculaceae bacterium]|nr:decaprenyl-phosphate phosphoribosyltransferase [Muribaculaceae bacterium]